MLATVDKEVSPRRDEGIPPYRLLALPAAYYKKLCRERLIPVQEPNQRSGWPLKFDCGRSDLPYIFRITLPAKNLSPFYPIRPEKYVDKPRFIWYIIQANFCGHGPLVKRLRQRPLTPLTWVRFPHGSPKNTPAYAGVFFRVSRARNRTGQCAAAHKNSPVDCFLARGRFPRVSPETLQLMLECFFVYPVQGIEPDGAQVLLCAIMERCVFGCILDMKIPPELFSLSTLGVAYQRSTGLHIFYFACLLAAWRLGRGMEHTMAMPRARATATFKVSMPLLVHRARSLRKK